MSNEFAEAGDEFRREQTRKLAARDQAAQALSEMQSFCEGGVQEFYGGQGDAYVERRGHELSIRFGFRPGKISRIVTGPFAVIFATPDGRLLWAANTDWVAATPGGFSEPPPNLTGQPIDLKDWRAELTRCVIEFLRQTEAKYQAAVA